MKKILVSFLTILLISVVMMGTVYAAQLETTIDITANVSEVSAGDKVVFTFALENVTNAKDDSIGAIEGTVTYDTNFFELVTGVTNTSFSAGGESGEKFNVLCGGAKDGETVAILTLKVKDNPTGSGIVKFTDLAASDGDVERGDEAIAKTADKSIEIKLKSTTPTEPTDPTEPDQPDDTTVAVTGVAVAPVSQKVKVGKSTTFIATVTPENATNKKVKWSSSDESIATINEDGVVTGIKEGEATITATTLDGSKKGTATIIVEKEEEQKPTDTEKPDDSNNSNNPTTPSTPSTDKPTTDGTTVTVGGKNNDPTIATTVLPKAGVSVILLIAVVAASAVAIIVYKKNQKFRDIK